MSTPVGRLEIVALHQTLREAEASAQHAAAGAVLAEEHGFVLLRAWNGAILGWAEVELADVRSALARIVAAVDAARATGTQQFQTYLCAVLADAYRRAGQWREGRDAVEHGRALAGKTGECFFEPELLRLEGEIAMRDTTANAGVRSRRTRAAIVPLEQAADLAKRHGAHLLEVRAAASLVRALNLEQQADAGLPRLRAALEQLAPTARCRDADEARKLLSPGRS